MKGNFTKKGLMVRSLNISSKKKNDTTSVLEREDKGWQEWFWWEELLDSNAK